MWKVNVLDILRPSVLLFPVKPGKQICSSSARFMPFRVLQECLVEVFTLGIPTWYTIISSATLDTPFRRSANGVKEKMICLIHIRLIRWRQSHGKFTCESNIAAPLGLAEAPLLYRLAWYRTSKPRWSNKKRSILRPWELFKDMSIR